MTTRNALTGREIDVVIRRAENGRAELEYNRPRESGKKYPETREARDVESGAPTLPRPFSLVPRAKTSSSGEHAARSSRTGTAAAQDIIA